MKLNPNASAFPRTIEVFDADTGKQTDRLACAGVSIRAYIATMAMQGILAGLHPVCHDREPDKVIASVALRFADALIARLNEEEE